MGKWFILENDDVMGPFDTDTLEKKIESGSIGSQCLIWGPPQNEWRSPSWWRSHLHEIVNLQHTPRKEQLWHFAVNESSQGPMSRNELIDKLKQVENKKEILVWTNGMSDWLPLFDIEDLMSELGISKRKHPRSSIQGQAIIQVNEQSYIGQLKTVSAGGCGITGLSDLEIGMEVHLTLKSNEFHQELRAKAEVRFVSKGYTGFMFTAINSEDKATIINYIRSHQVQFKLSA